MAIDRPTHIVLKPKASLIPQKKSAEVPEPRERPVIILEEPAPPEVEPQKKRSEASFFEKKKDAQASLPAKCSEAQRDFIIAYDGTFIGHYQAPRRTTGRTALQMVAHRLEEKLGAGFNLDKLELFRPVRLRIDREKVNKDLVEGSFEWFG